MNQKMINAAAGAIFFSALFSGCSSEGPGALRSHYINSAERDSVAVVLDKSLMPGWFDKLLNNGMISFEHPVARRIPGSQLMKVESEIRNRQNKPLELELSTVFRDGSNIIVDESKWEKFKLSPNQTISYKINSIGSAEKYCIRMRMPRRNTNALNGQGVNLMADKMLRSLMRCPAILKSNKSPRIALHQLDNRTNQKMDESVFLSKLRAEINSRNPGKIIFVSRRDDVLDVIEEERRKKREGLLTHDKSKSKEKLSGVSYFITGKLHTLPGKTYLLFAYQLVDSENSDILWEDQFEIGDY